MKRAFLWCLLANLIGGSTFVAMDRANASGLPTVTFSFLRTLLSVLLFVVIAAWRRELRPRFDARDWGLVLLVAVPGFAFPLVLGIRGVALSTPGLGSILALVEPIAMVPLSFFFLGERMRPLRLVGMGIGLVGALLVVQSDALPGALAASDERRLGNILLALQGALWAVYSVAGKPLMARHSAFSVSFWSTTLGCLALGLVAPLEWAQLRPTALDGVARALWLQEGVPAGMSVVESLSRAMPSMVFLGVFASFLAVLLWNAGLAGVSTMSMAVFVFVQPAVGLLLNAAVGEEAPALFGWIGLSLILGAVVLVARGEPARPMAAPLDPGQGS